MSNLIILGHAYNTDWDIELLNQEFEYENTWVKRNNDILSEDQLWKREDQNTWFITSSVGIKYSMDMFLKGCLLPYRSEIFSMYIDECSDTQKILVQSKSYGNINDEKIVSGKMFPKGFDPFLNSLDRIMVDKIMSSSFHDLWKKWSEEESFV